jgi:tetratricopeptide (TPR) repeat protein
LAEARRQFQIALTALESTPTVVEASRVQLRLGYLLFSSNQWVEAVTQVRSAMEISNQLSDLPGLAAANRVMGLIALERGNLGAARDHNEQSLRLYRELEDLPRMAALCNNLGDVYRSLGQMEQALISLQEGLELARRVGTPREESLLLLTTAELFLDQGNSEEAITQLEQALPLAEESGAADIIILVNQVFGSACISAGHFERARSYLQRALTFGQETGYLRFAPVSYLEWARLHTVLGSQDEVKANLRRAWESAGPNPSKVFLCRAFRYLGNFHCRVKHWNEGTESLRKALVYAQQAHLVADEAKTHFALGIAYAGRGSGGDHALACAQLVEAERTFKRIGAYHYRKEVEMQLEQLGCGPALSDPAEQSPIPAVGG